MPIQLVKPIAAFFAADMGDSDADARCFTENAVVSDAGHSTTPIQVRQPFRTNGPSAASARVQWSEPARTFGVGEFTPLAQRLESAARTHPHCVALVDGARRITYRELLARADVLAAELQVRGIGANDLVGVLLPRCAELVIAIAGILRAGAAYLPVDFGHPAGRRELILADARPRAVVVADGSRVAGIPSACESLPFMHESLHRLQPRPRSAPGDLAYVIYTSGSTGRPKGVRVTQRNVTRLFTTSEPLFGFGPQDTWSLFHSIAFDFSVWELWGALLYGGRLVIVPEKTAKASDAFHALVVSEGVTVLNQTPSAFRAFDRADAAAGRPSKPLRCVIFGGEALDPRTLRSWFEAYGDERPRLVNMYGITETTVHVTYRRMRAQDARGTGQILIGAPLPDLRIELLGPDGCAVDEGQTGEICVGGEGVADGYLARAQLSAERFRPDPRGSGPNARRYHSGDLARRMPDGDLEYLGRADLQVKLRGFRIELGEIEATLRDAAGVREAVVALHEDPIVGPRLVAYLVLDGSAPIDADALRTHAADRLPEHMVPAAYVQIERVPRTANDKVDRAALPASTAADLPRATGGEAPRGELEQAIAGIFADVLATAVTTRESDFFRLGGHSLLAWRVVVLCQERLGVTMSVNAVFSHPGVAAFADVVRREQEKGRSAAEVLRVPRGDAQPLAPQQVALWLDLKLRPQTTAYHEPIAFRVASRLTPERVRRALETLFAAHEVLCARASSSSRASRASFSTPRRRPSNSRFGVAPAWTCRPPCAVRSTSPTARCGEPCSTTIHPTAQCSCWSCTTSSWTPPPCISSCATSPRPIPIPRPRCRRAPATSAISRHTSACASRTSSRRWSASGAKRSRARI